MNYSRKKTKQGGGGGGGEDMEFPHVLKNMWKSKGQFQQM